MTDSLIVRTEDPTPAFFSWKTAAPGRLRWAESTYVAAYRPARSWLVALVVTALWNAGFLLLVPRKQLPIPLPVSVVFVLGVLLVALREALLVVRVQMNTDRIVVERGLPWPWARFSVHVSEIERFVVANHPTDGSFRLEAIVHGAGSRRVPISFDGPPIRGNWSPRRFFAAPVESYSFAAERLNVMLDAAKHRTGPTYR